jgi:hypothetical protein
VSTAFEHKSFALFITRRARADRKVERAEAEKAIEILDIHFVTGKIFAVPVFEVFKRGLWPFGLIFCLFRLHVFDRAS